MKTPSARSIFASALLLTFASPQCGFAATEPWQLWLQRPIQTPVVLTTIINAAEGTDVSFAVGDNTYVSTAGSGPYTTNVFIAELTPQQTYLLQITGSEYYDSFPAYNLYVHLGKSTQELAVYRSGNLVFKQLLALQAITDGVPLFSPVENRIFTYDSLGHLTNELWMDALHTNIARVVYEASWKGPNNRDCELKAWEISGTGEKLTFAYNSLKRLTNVTHVGVAAAGDHPAQSDISTNFVFDAAGRLKTQSIVGGALTLSRAFSYDLSGRLTSVSGFEGLSTNITYSADTRTVTNTLPGGATIIQSVYLDGRPKSLTGTGGVNEFYDYSITDDVWHPYNRTCPKNIKHTSFATLNSGRWIEEVSDVYDVTWKKIYPGFGTGPDGATTLEETYSSVCGIPTHRETPSTMFYGQIMNYAETYTPNGYGENVGTSRGSGAGPSRWSGTDTFYAFDGNDWHLSSYSSQWVPAGTITNSVRARLTGFASANVLSELTITDPDTNITTVTVYLDRAAKKITTITNTPQSTINITNITINSLVQSLNSQSVAPPTRFYYDSLARLRLTQDPLGNTSSVVYDASTGQILATTDPSGQTTSYSYYAGNEAGAGRLKCQTNAKGRNSCYDYTIRGEPQHIWGDVPYPEERVYNSLGELTTLRTFQGGTAWSSSNTWPGAGVQSQSTIWNYDTATGLLLSKVDALGRGYTNDYLFPRTFWTRTWARGVTITNTLNEFGEVTQKDYSDGTPSVSIQYNILGEPEYVTDALGYRQFTYDFAGRPTSAPWWQGMYVRNRYDPLYGRDQMVLEQDGTNALVHDYRFDANSGRMHLVSNNTMTVEYNYLPNSDLLQSTVFKNESTNVLTTTQAWDYGFRLHSIANVVNRTTLSSHQYRYDSLNRRIQAALEDGSSWNYDYNDRNELTGARRYWSDWSPVSGQQFAYDYDNVGNRKGAASGGDVNGCNVRWSQYSANALNQYTNILTPGYEDICGVARAYNAVEVTNALAGTGGIADRKGEYFHRELSISNTNCALWQTVSTTSGGSVSNGGFAFTKYDHSLTYDADGNLTFDGIWTYEWDTESQLKAMSMAAIPSLPVGKRLRLEFAYDFMGRRVSKTVGTWDGSTMSGPVTNRFLYDGWNVVAILNDRDTLVQSFVWGQDLSGTMAGGIGGLLVLTQKGDSDTNCFVSYDGNGNIVALADAASGATAALYEYSPYGELIRCTGAMAIANPFQWSTKFFDHETGLVYYGCRYYSPILGRWVNRDPAGEDGGNHLYLSVRNSPILTFDPDGRTPQQLIALSKVGAVADAADLLFTCSTFVSFPGMNLNIGGMGGAYLDGIAAGLSIGVDVALGGRLLKNIGGPDVFAAYLGLGGWMGVPRIGIARLGRQQSLAAAVVSGRLAAVSAIGDAALAQATGAGSGTTDLDAAAYGFLQAARRGDTAWADLDAALIGFAIWKEGITGKKGLLNAAGTLISLLNGDAADAFSNLPSYQALNAWDMAIEMEDFVEGW